MIKFLAALALVFSSPVMAPPVQMAPMEKPSDTGPTVDLSAVRYLICKDNGKFYTGSAFLIAPHILATARHVAHLEKCMDAETATPVTPYHEDDVHDFALMNAPGLPTNIPYVHYKCSGMKPNKPYLSYGITDYKQAVPILRMNTIYSTDQIVDIDNLVRDFPHSLGMREFKGPIAPGMSGGPVVDLDGYAVAVNNAGDDKSTSLFDLKDTVLCK